MLLVEDCPEDQFLTKRHLQGEVLSAASLTEVGQMDIKSVDVVLLDLHLPDGAGPELVSRLQHLTDAPVVILTGASDPDAEGLLSLGAQDYIRKGQISEGRLARAIRFAIARDKSRKLATETARIERDLHALQEEVACLTEVMRDI